MSNVLIRATAEGLPSFTRRNLFASVAGACLATGAAGMASTAAAAVYDPMADLGQRFTAALAAQSRMNDHDCELYGRTVVGALYDELWVDTPETRSLTGVIAALKMVSDPDYMQEQDIRVIQSALAYLEGRPS